MYSSISYAQTLFQRKNNLSRNIVWQFIMYIASMGMTSYVKIVKYIINFPVYTEGTYIYNILYNYRFTSFFACLASVLFYQFYIDVFIQKEKIIKGKSFVIIYSLIASVCQFIPIFSGINEIIIKSLLLLQVTIIYFPVAVNSYKMVQRTKWEKTEKELYWGFFLLYLLSVFFIGIWLSYVSSVILDMILDQSYGIFYLIMQGFVIGMMVCVYLCFIMPSWFKRFIEKHEKTTDLTSK